MDNVQALILALVQGLTEFLPISSSAHLILPAQMFGWPDQGLAFDVAVHLGTLLAVVAYSRRDLWAMTRGAGDGVVQRRRRARGGEEGRRAQRASHAAQVVEAHVAPAAAGGAAAPERAAVGARRVAGERAVLRPPAQRSAGVPDGSGRGQNSGTEAALGPCVVFRAPVEEVVRSGGCRVVRANTRVHVSNRSASRSSRVAPPSVW